MNRIARTLFVALPLSAAALTLSPGTAHAETPAPAPGPVIVMPAEPVDPEPMDIANPNPAPQPPKDIANPDPAPQPPKDIANPDPAPQPNPGPEGPGEITDVPDCTHGCDEDPTPDFPLDSGEGNDDEDPTPDFPLDGGCFEGCDLPEDETTGEIEDVEIAGVTTPTRVDAGLGQNDDNGLQLTWLLASGALVTAGGATLVARRKAQTKA